MSHGTDSLQQALLTPAAPQPAEGLLPIRMKFRKNIFQLILKTRLTQ